MEKVNIGIKMNFDNFTTLAEVKRQLQANKDKIKVRISDYRTVHDYLKQRYWRRKKREKQIITKMQTYIQLKNDFVEALSTEFNEEEKKQKLYGGLSSQKAIDVKCKLLNFLNFKTNGGFTEETDFDEKKRGYFVKFNILLLDHKLKLAVLQGFQYLQWKTKEHSTSRRNYYLVGLTEEGRSFTHVITGQIAWRLQELWLRDEDWYSEYLRWAFGIEKNQEYIRQGDVALIRLKSKVNLPNLSSYDFYKINNSHALQGNIKVAKNYIVVEKPSVLIHLRNQHETLYVPPACYKYAIAKKSSLWDFSRAIKD